MRLAIVLVAVALQQAAAPATPVSEAEVRSFVQQAGKSAAPTDSVGFMAAYHRLISPLFKQRTGSMFVGVSHTIYSTDELTVNLIGPLSLFDTLLEDAARRMDPVDNLPWPTGVTVTVAPLRMSSPDIIKVVVTRDDAIVQPTDNSLKETVFQNSMSANKLAHKGTLTFPASAFQPGAAVLIMLIPSSGEKIKITISADELSRIQ